MPDLSNNSGNIPSEVASQALIWNKILSITDSLVLKCALKLEIFDAIHAHGRPISLASLASSLPTPCRNHSVLLRLLRYLSHIRLVDIAGADPPLFSLPPSSSSFLVSSSKQSLASFVAMFLDEGFLGAFHSLDACVSRGEGSAFEILSGETVFGKAAMDLAMSRKFDEGMAGSGRVTAEAMVEGAARVFEGVRTMVDVGGGTGTTARVIRGRFDGIRVLVMDLGHVVGGLVGSDGVEFVEGDMFVQVPRADAILLMVIAYTHIGVLRARVCLE